MKKCIGNKNNLGKVSVKAMEELTAEKARRAALSSIGNEVQEQLKEVDKLIGIHATKGDMSFGYCKPLRPESITSLERRGFVVKPCSERNEHYYNITWE
jgi:hypothetical protein